MIRKATVGRKVVEALRYHDGTVRMVEAQIRGPNPDGDDDRFVCLCDGYGVWKAAKKDLYVSETAALAGLLRQAAGHKE